MSIKKSSNKAQSEVVTPSKIEMLIDKLSITMGGYTEDEQKGPRNLKSQRLTCNKRHRPRDSRQ